MKCSNHAETEADASCDICHRAFCRECLVELQGHPFCTRCRTRPDFLEVSGLGQGTCRPGLAFFLGLIPGVGAICNGEYIKAVLHVVIFGFLVSIQSGTHLGTFEPLFGMLTGAFYFYMPIEACQTAKRRILEAHGLIVPPLPIHGRAASLWAGILLTVMGTLLFLDTIKQDLIEQVLRFWPLALIGFGIHRLWVYFNHPKAEEKRK
jgi:hypothetical protein